jgi:hypothetical protein
LAMWIAFVENSTIYNALPKAVQPCCCPRFGCCNPSDVGTSATRAKYQMNRRAVKPSSEAVKFISCNCKIVRCRDGDQRPRPASTFDGAAVSRQFWCSSASPKPAMTCTAETGKYHPSQVGCHYFLAIPLTWHPLVPQNVPALSDKAFPRGKSRSKCVVEFGVVFWGCQRRSKFVALSFLPFQIHPLLFRPDNCPVIRQVG